MIDKGYLLTFLRALLSLIHQARPSANKGIPTIPRPNIVKSPPPKIVNMGKPSAKIVAIFFAGIDMNSHTKPANNISAAKMAMKPVMR